MNNDEESKYRRELQELKHEHSQLDSKITRFSMQENSDQLRIQRLKKRKLWIRDRIVLIERILYPDIIA